jgi:phosphoglycerol transferase MdoB-like AlkP superfamily enzyme
VQAATILDRFTYRAVLPLLAISAALLHAYTAYMAFRLSPTTLQGLAAALAAWIAPPIAELVIAYAAWRSSGSVVNGYSSWLLAWIALLSLFLLLILVHRHLRPYRMAMTPQQDSVM